MKQIILTAVFLTAALTGIESPAQSSIDDWTLKGRLEKHVYLLADDTMRGREAGSFQAGLVADYIANQFRSMGLEPYTDSTYFQWFNEGPRGARQCRNVIGILRGVDDNLRDEYVVIGAHYDHLGTKIKDNEKIIYNGADDNASGVAALIEVAGELVYRQLKRSVIFVAFDAEELGLKGSNYFVNNPVVPLEQIKLMMSIDMVGWYDMSGTLYYSGGGTMKDAESLILGYDVLPYGLNVELEDFEKNVFVSTDTEPFALKGIPTLHVTTGTKSPYHQPGDRPELIDYEGLELVTRHITDVTAKICEEEDYMSSGIVSPKHSTGKVLTFGLSLNAGANSHHYTKGSVDGKNAGIYGLGFYSNVRLSKSLSLRAEALYERTGAKHPDGKVWLNSVTVPVNVIIGKRNLSSFAFYAAFGGYYSHHFSGKQDGDKIDFANKFYRNEGGLSWGLGMSVSKVSMGVTVRYAISEFTRHKNIDNAHIKNRSTFFNLSYRF